MNEKLLDLKGEATYGNRRVSIFNERFAVIDEDSQETSVQANTEQRAVDVDDAEIPVSPRQRKENRHNIQSQIKANRGTLTKSDANSRRYSELESFKRQ